MVIFLQVYQYHRFNIIIYRQEFKCVNFSILQIKCHFIQRKIKTVNLICLSSIALFSMLELQIVTTVYKTTAHVLVMSFQLIFKILVC